MDIKNNARKDSKPKLFHHFGRLCVMCIYPKSPLSFKRHRYFQTFIMITSFKKGIQNIASFLAHLKVSPEGSTRLLLSNLKRNPITVSLSQELPSIVWEIPVPSFSFIFWYCTISWNRKIFPILLVMNVLRRTNRHLSAMT